MATQLRAICPACFAQQATKNGRMVQHGYTRPQGWHQNVGTCFGVNKPHFGTEAGRDVVKGIADGLRRNATELDARQARLLSGDSTEPVYAAKREFGRTMMVVVAEPSQAQRDAYAARLGHEASDCRRAAVDYDAKAAAWQPAEPVAVPVEKKETTIHFRATWYNKHGHKACAASAMGAMKWAHVTDDPTKVTCDRCKGRKSFVDAMAKVNG